MDSEKTAICSRCDGAQRICNECGKNNIDCECDAAEYSECDECGGIGSIEQEEEGEEQHAATTMCELQCQVIYSRGTRKAPSPHWETVFEGSVLDAYNCSDGDFCVSGQIDRDDDGAPITRLMVDGEVANYEDFEFPD